MKARTRREREVEELSRRLAPLSSSDMEFARTAGVEHTGLYTGKRVKCTECGHVWQQQGLKKQVRCPHCNTLLTLRASRCKKASEVCYMVVLQSCRGWQVCRYFRLKWSCPVNGGRTLCVDEAVQHWIGSDGKLIVLARPRIMGFYIDNFNYKEPMSIKRNVSYSAWHLPYWAVRVKSVLPVLRRNGYKQNLFAMQPYDLFCLLLTNPFAETLYKAGYGNLLRILDYRRVLHDDNYIAAVKIVLRNYYPLKSKDDVVMWLDMVESLIKLDKDVHNRHFVCPANLKQAHDRAMEQVRRKQELERRRTRAEQLRKDKKLAKSYVKRMGKYFDLLFTHGNIVIGVLKSVAEFEEEGKAMHHCVFANKYFAKENSLVMSARVGGERMETIEIDLRDCQLVQSRGVNNGISPYHDEIVALVNANLFQIRKLSGIA